MLLCGKGVGARILRSGVARRLLACTLALLLATLLAFPAYAGEGGEPDALTLEEAIKQALINSKDLELAKNNVDLAKTKKDETWDMYNAVLIKTHIPGTDMYVSVPTGQDPTGAVFKTDYDWRVAQKDYETKVASVVASVYQKYSAALLAGKQVEVARLNVALRERELYEAEARLRVGAESNFSVVQKRSALASARAELRRAEEQLSKAYGELVEFLGLPKGSRPVLITQVSFNPMVVEDLDQEIENIIESSPQLWKAQETVKLQKNIYGMVNSYDVDRINLKNAQLGVDITRDQLYLALVGAYVNVKSLEEDYGKAQESLGTAREFLRIALLRYDLGMATRAEVMSAQAAVAAAEAQLANLAWQHARAVRAFYEPWAWSGSGAAAASSGGSSAGQGTGR